MNRRIMDKMIMDRIRMIIERMIMGRIRMIMNRRIMDSMVLNKMIMKGLSMTR